MSTAPKSPAAPRWASGAAAALAVVVAAVYFAIGLGLVADDFKSPPEPLMMLAGLAYVTGGVLILRASRLLLIAGVVANIVVLLLFVASAVRGNATVDLFSLTGKAAQVALGVLLVCLIRWRRA